MLLKRDFDAWGSGITPKGEEKLNTVLKASVAGLNEALPCVQRKALRLEHRNDIDESGGVLLPGELFGLG